MLSPPHEGKEEKWLLSSATALSKLMGFRSNMSNIRLFQVLGQESQPLLLFLLLPPTSFSDKGLDNTAPLTTIPQTHTNRCSQEHWTFQALTQPANKDATLHPKKPAQQVHLRNSGPPPYHCPLMSQPPWWEGCQFSHSYASCIQKS